MIAASLGFIPFLGRATKSDDDEESPTQGVPAKRGDERRPMEDVIDFHRGGGRCAQQADGADRFQSTYH